MKTDTETSAKVKLYKTAYAAISCAHFAKNECVAVRYDWTDELGTHWFIINKTERGECPEVAYPGHHLTRFCL